MVMRILPRLIARECIVFADERLREVKMAVSRECPAFYINHWDGVDEHGPNVEFRELDDWDELSAENTHTLVESSFAPNQGGVGQWVADYGMNTAVQGEEGHGAGRLCSSCIEATCT